MHSQRYNVIPSPRTRQILSSRKRDYTRISSGTPRNHAFPLRMVPFCASVPPATSFPFSSAYFTPRVVHAAAPLHTIQTTHTKKATHTHVSRLSHFVIRPSLMLSYGANRVFRLYPFSRGRGRCTICCPEKDQRKEALFRTVSQPCPYISARFHMQERQLQRCLAFQTKSHLRQKPTVPYRQP